jgi:hypothetical protein
MRFKECSQYERLKVKLRKVYEKQWSKENHCEFGEMRNGKLNPNFKLLIIDTHYSIE